MMKVAIIHYWLVSERGGEKVVEALCRMFPEADVFTHVYDPGPFSAVFGQTKIRTSFIQRLPLARKAYQAYLPLMPLALEQLDLSDYDLVISSESGPAKGVITRPETCHICYCHTPMRYLWDMYHEYRQSSGLFKRLVIPLLAHYLRLWDLASADRVDYFVANSRHVANRIRKHYRREAEVIFPPVDVSSFEVSDAVEDYYLMVGQLTRYKRPDLAVRAFSRSGRRLVIIGEGEELRELKKIAGPNVQFLGRQPFAVIKTHYSRCRAFIFPGEEDFGITPLEAQASGRPVIAYGRGGALETVRDGETGIFFESSTVESLLEAVERFEAVEHSFDSQTIRRHSLAFSQERFLEQMRAFVECRLADHSRIYRS